MCPFERNKNSGNMAVGIEPRTAHVLGKLADMCLQTREC